MSYTQWCSDGALIPHDADEAPELWKESEVNVLTAWSLVKKKKKYLLSVCDVPSIVLNTWKKQAKVTALMRLESAVAPRDGIQGPVQHYPNLRTCTWGTNELNETIRAKTRPSNSLTFLLQPVWSDIQLTYWLPVTLQSMYYLILRTNVLGKNSSISQRNTLRNIGG